MTSRTIVGVIVMLAVLGLVFWWQQQKEESQPQAAIVSVSAFNETKNQDALQAESGDIVVFTLNVENPNDETLEGYIVETNISDLQELSDLIDAEGANYNPVTGSLIWTPLSIPAKSTISKKVKVQVKSLLPSDSDLVMRMKFGNELAVAVIKPQVAGESDQPLDAGISPANYVSPNSGMPLSISLFLAVCMTLGVSLYRVAHKMN